MGLPGEPKGPMSLSISLTDARLHNETARLQSLCDKDLAHPPDMARNMLIGLQAGEHS
jgi:hypothetical protein